MIKNCRIRAKFTQEEVADRLGIDRSTVAKWKTGTASPRADKLLQLARILNCTADELLLEEDDPAPERNGIKRR